jgi:hypothetical protein
VLAAAPDAALPGAAAALPLLLAQLAPQASGGAAPPCTPQVVQTAFRLRHWALVHATAGGFTQLCSTTLAQGGGKPFNLVPPDAAAGDRAGVTRLLQRAVLAQRGASGAADALASPEEAAALSADAAALVAACG